MLLLGSCFSDNIGSLLSKYKFNAAYNGIGIIYNPATLRKIIQLAVDKNTVCQEEVRQNKDVYCHLDFHSKYNSLKKADVLTKINQDLIKLHSHLTTADYIFLTLGTAIVHTELKSQTIVGNCHKFPASQFEKRILSVEEIQNYLQEIIISINKLNKNVQIIFTLSPVRHVKEGLRENAISKARLLSAISELKNNAHVSYFPSYEIMQDDLRDYRYYKSDLIHPNKLAIQYIWNIFSEVYFSQSTKELNKKLSRIIASTKHKAFHPKSKQHQKFLKALLQKIDALESEEKNIKLSNERKKIKKQILD